MPLGAGFRNASTPKDCCLQCAAESKCSFFSFSSDNVGSHKGPKHNCWLKSSKGGPEPFFERVCLSAKYRYSLHYLPQRQNSTRTVSVDRVDRRYAAPFCYAALLYLNVICKI